MTFAWPAALFGLLAAPVAVGVYVVASRRPSRYPVNYPNLEVLASVAARRRPRRLLPAALLLAGAVAMLLAIARPQARVLVPRDDATVVLVMDSSGSMSSRDVEPSRLRAARESAVEFTNVVPERFRLGVVSFSDVADVVRMPTTDHAAVTRALDSLHAGGGTAIGDGLMAALHVIHASGAVASDSGSLSAILLLSDGASTTGTDPLAAARVARNHDVPVFTVALGTVPAAGPAGAVTWASSLTTPPDVRTLRAIARTTGGRSFSAPSEADLTQIYRDLGSRLGFEWRREEITAAFAVGAALLLVLAVATGLRRRAFMP